MSHLSELSSGMIQSETKVGDFDAIVPQVKGGAYLCGEAT